MLSSVDLTDLLLLVFGKTEQSVTTDQDRRASRLDLRE